MARLWSCGFETQTIGFQAEASANYGLTAPTVSTTTVRTGLGAMRVAPTTTSSVCGTAATLTGLGSATGHYYVRAYVNIATLPSAAQTAIISLGASSTVGATQVSVLLSSTGTLQLGTSGSSGSGSTTSISSSTWHRVEIDYDDNTDVLKGYLNGTLFSTLTSINLAGVGTQVFFGSLASTNSCDLYFDDLAVNDSTGSAENGLVGAGGIYHLMPAGTGDSNGFTSSAVGGTAGAANNYTRVNEVPANSSTSYNGSSDSTATVKDEFTITSPTTAGIGSGDTIRFVAVGQQVASGTNSVFDLKIFSRIKGQSGGTVVESPSAIDCNTGSGTSFAIPQSGSGSTDPKNYLLTTYLNPQTSAAWTPATVATAQIGYRASGTGGFNRNVSNLWALVEAVPGAPSTNAPAGQAAVAADSQDPSVQNQTNGAQAAATADAFDATVSTGSSASAFAETTAVAVAAQDAAIATGSGPEAPAVTAGAQAPQVSAGTAAEATAVAAAAQDAKAASSVQAEATAVAVTGFDATVSISGSTSAPAEATAVTAAAQDAGASNGSQAEATAVVSTSFDATVSTSSSVNAPAEQTAVSAAAFDATISTSVAVLAQLAAVTADAYLAAVSTASFTNAAAEQPAVTVTAFDVTTVLVSNSSAELTSVACSALGATISTSSSTSAPAEAALVQVGAFNASITMTILPSTAAVSVVAGQPPPPGVTSSPNSFLVTETRSNSITTGSI